MKNETAKKTKYNDKVKRLFEKKSNRGIKSFYKEFPKDIYSYINLSYIAGLYGYEIVNEEIGDELVIYYFEKYK